MLGQFTEFGDQFLVGWGGIHCRGGVFLVSFFVRYAGRVDVVIVTAAAVVVESSCLWRIREKKRTKKKRIKRCLGTQSLYTNKQSKKCDGEVKVPT